MKKFSIPFTVSQISTRIEGKVHLIDDRSLDNVAELAESNPGSVCFYENPKFRDDLVAARAGLIFVPPDFLPENKPATNLILVDKPYITFIMLIRNWLELCNPGGKGIIAPTAQISDSTSLGKNVQIDDFVKIDEEVTIGDNVIISAGCVIGKQCQIERDTVLYPRVTLYEGTKIGERVIVHAGCVIGADGFGFLLHGGRQNKIPQVGNVVIDNDVEIGANTTIDRATLGSTRIGEGTKIDNLVQIGHNCLIGKHSIICAQTGLAGSTIIGDYVYLAGQVGVAGHLKIGDGAMIGAQSGVSNDIPEGVRYFGTPAIDAGIQKRIIASQKQIPELVKFVNRLRKSKGEE